MAAGESPTSTLRCYLRQTISSFKPLKNLPSLADNSTDLSDAFSDSGSEFNENSRNVVQWLRSLPAENQWCEAEEQIGRPDSSEALIDGISSIGDSDVPITLKNQAKFHADSSTVKKVSKEKKYRRGALHANSIPKESPKSSKKSTTSGEKIGVSKKSVAASCEKIGGPKKSIIACEKNGVSKKSITSDVKSGASKKSVILGKKKAVSKKSKKFSIAAEITEVIDDLETGNDETAKIGVMDYRPVFHNPEFGRMLDEKMSRAINLYKRNERGWPVSSEFSSGNYEPPTKKSKGLLS